jgi:hypothetical protein
VLKALDRGVAAPEALTAGYADLAAKLQGEASVAGQVELLFDPVKRRLEAGIEAGPLGAKAPIFTRVAQLDFAFFTRSGSTSFNLHALYSHLFNVISHGAHSTRPCRVHPDFTELSFSFVAAMCADQLSTAE